MRFDLTWLQLGAALLAGGGIVAAVTIGGVLLGRRSGSRPANVAFGALMLVCAALVLYVLLIYIQPPGEHLGIVFAPLPFTFAVGPLLYAYVRARLGRSWPGLGHWALPAAQAVLVVGVAASPVGVQQGYMGRVFAPWWGTVQTAVFVAGLAAYLVLSWREIGSAGPPAYDWERSRVRWLRVVVRTATIGLAGVVAFSLVGPLAPALHRHELLGVRWMPLVETLLYSAVVYALALGGFVQADVRPPHASPPDPPRSGGRLHPEIGGPEPGEDETAAVHAAAVHAAALARLIREERPHLDPDLSLGSLADQLGVTDKTLSALFNATLGTTYTDYVNGLRVEEARRRLADPAQSHLTVLGVGLDAGFASKSTFNRVFKDRTGETPSAYRQRAAPEGPNAA